MSLSDVVKLVVHVPTTHTEAVRDALGNAGAGKIGNYSHCSFTVRGTGRFLSGESAKPFLGEPGKFEEVIEDSIEVKVERTILPEVVKAMKEAHPYEEVSYDIIPLENTI